MAIKFADSPARSKPTHFCPNKDCLLHWLRTDETFTPRPRLYRRDTILLEQGDSVLHCYSICAGLVKVARRTVHGKTATVDLRGPGELIGARELLANEPVFDVYAQTLCETKAMRLERTYLLDLVQRRPEFLREISRRVAQIAGAVQRRFSHALRASVEGKIAFSLNYLHQKQTFVQIWGGQACEQLCNDAFSNGPSPRLATPLSRYTGKGLGMRASNGLLLSNDDIAELVGSTPETVSKALCEFAKRGLIVRERCQLQILDPQGLRELAEDLTLVGV